MLSVSSATSTRLRRGKGDGEPNSITRNILRRLRNRFANARRHGNPLVKAVPLELAIERAAADPEQTRGDRFVAANLLQRPNDVFALDLDERRRSVVAARRARGTAERRRRSGHQPLLLHAPRQIAFADEVALRKDAR